MGIIYRLLPVTNFTQLFNKSAQAKVLDALLSLHSAETVTTSDLVSRTGLSRRAVMENLARLVDIGLVTKEGYGRSVFYWGIDNKSPLGKRFISIYGIITNVRIREATVPSKHTKANSRKQKVKPKRPKKGAE